MNSIRTSAEDAREAADKSLFEAISNDIATDGYSVRCNVLGPDLLAGLSSHVQNMDPSSFKKAGVGRKQQHSLNNLVRTDEICWISGDSEAESAWIKWAESLQRYLNRSMFLGLFSFESHFAHYAKGDFYKKHQDSFKGEANRVLSIVVYLNKEWLADDGGELLIYQKDINQNPKKVVPSYGTVVAFLSEEFPHEVLPAKRDRFSIAGWYRVNTIA